jgi:hypothetical protein
MSRPFDFIKDLNKEREIWKIAVRVIDCWIVTWSNGQPHIEGRYAKYEVLKVFIWLFI